MAISYAIKPDPVMTHIRVNGIEYTANENDNFILPLRSAQHLVGRFPHKFEHVYLMLVSTDPENEETGVAVETVIDFTFAEAIEDGGDMQNEVSLTAGGEEIEITVAISGTTVLRITPDSYLENLTEYTVKVNRGAVVSVAEGLATEGDLTIKFTTVAGI